MSQVYRFVDIYYIRKRDAEAIQSALTKGLHAILVTEAQSGK